MWNLFDELVHQNYFYAFLLIPVVSLLGSSHCFLMCVPFLLNFDLKNNKLYHFGRLFSYFLIGSVIWYLSSEVLNSELFKLSAGLLFLLFFIYHSNKSHSCHLRPKVQNIFLFGVVNGFLPCAWLYLSLFIFSQVFNYSGFLLSVFLFWAGTLPVFSVLKFKNRIFNSIPILKLKSIRATLLIAIFFITFMSHFSEPTSNIKLNPENLICSSLNKESN